jgi:hypothetical protein
MQKYLGHDGQSMVDNRGFYFADMFDWVVMKDKIAKKTDRPRHVYIKLDFLPKYMKTLLSIDNEFILVSACSDRWLGDSKYIKEYETLLRAPNIKTIYCENNIGSNSKTRPLPVGFATHSRGYEDQLMRIRSSTNIKNKRNKILCCWRSRNSNCCGSYFVERPYASRFSQAEQNLHICDNYRPTMTQYEFQTLIASYKWCLCPLGNGTDPAPRILECLFLKTVPIVKRSPNALKLYHAYPIIWVNTFDEITEDMLVYDENADWDKVVNEFTCEYWFNKITNA